MRQQLTAPFKVLKKHKQEMSGDQTKTEEASEPELLLRLTCKDDW